MGAPEGPHKISGDVVADPKADRPEEGLGIVAFANASSPAAHEVSEGSIERILGVPEPASSRLPRKGALKAPHLRPELHGFYGPERVAYAGEIEARVKDNHLTMRALADQLGKGTKLYPVDAVDPMSFEAKVEERPGSVVSERDPTSGRVD